MCQICLKFATFAENKLRSANRKPPFFALACIIFAENRLRSTKQRIVYFMFCTAYSGRKRIRMK